MYEVWTFNYYLLTHTDVNGDEQIVGFFSKEKRSWNEHNLACIFVLPPWQKKGLGKILTELSYEISRQQGVIGGPERPISDVGHIGYMRLWGKKICKYLLETPLTDTKIGTGESNIRIISQATGVSPLDCIDFFDSIVSVGGPQMMRKKDKQGIPPNYGASNKYNFDYHDNSVMCRWLRGTSVVSTLIVDRAGIRDWLEKWKIDVDEIVVDPRYVTLEEEDLRVF